jgi:hypothetical protein
LEANLEHIRACAVRSPLICLLRIVGAAQRDQLLPIAGVVLFLEAENQPPQNALNHVFVLWIIRRKHQVNIDAMVFRRLHVESHLHVWEQKLNLRYAPGGLVLLTSL